MTTTSLVAKSDIDKTDKLAEIMEMVISLDELDNTDNLEDARLSIILFRYLVNEPEDFTRCEPVALQYKKCKNEEFASLTLRITDQKGNGITDSPGITIDLHIT